MTTEIAALDNDVKSLILTIRGVQVVLDRDLAMLYGVTTKRLNEQMKRNLARFPDTFRFVLSSEEMVELVVNCDWFKMMKHSSVPMRAFTEHGIIMLASVLKSDVAVEASIRITKTFVAMRKALASVAPVLNRLETVERRQIVVQARNEERIDTIFKAMDGGDFPPPAKVTGAFHDRFLIVDDKDLYHFGASLKDLGRKYCAVTKMDAMFIPSILQRI